MSTFLTLKQPCLAYKATVKHSDFEKIKLKQVYDNGTTKEKKTPTFDGKLGGIEGLLYVEEAFRSTARQLDFDTGAELFDNFEEVLTDTAIDKWENIVSAIPQNQRTVARFNQSIEAFYRRYVDARARDVMISYIKTIKKPVQATVMDHSDRMETLMRYTNRLPGTEPLLTEQQMKNYIFDSYSMTWKENYERSGRNIETDTLAQINEYMSNEKQYADRRESNKKRNNDNPSGGNKTKRLRGGGQYEHGKQINKGPKSMCKYHNTHTWENCIYNPKGKNYRPDLTPPNRNGGNRYNPNNRGRNVGNQQRGRLNNNQGRYQGNAPPNNHNGGNYFYNNDNHQHNDRQVTFADQQRPAPGAPPVGWNMEAHQSSSG